MTPTVGLPDLAHSSKHVCWSAGIRCR